MKLFSIKVSKKQKDTMSAQRIEKSNFMKFILMLIVLGTLTTAYAKEEIEGPTNENIETDISSDMVIKSFNFLQSNNTSISKNIVGQINEADKTINVVIPKSTTLNGLIPNIETPLTYSPRSAQNFENSVEYTIMADDGTSVKYLVTVSIKKTEREVLQTILDANPSSFLNWDLSPSSKLSSLEGVKVNLNGKIEKLELGQLNIRSIPKEIGQLTDLKTLYLHENSITSLPPEIGQLVNLKTLTLHNNSITSLPQEIGNLVNIQELLLERNLLTSVPMEVGNLVNLEYLSLNVNSIPNLPAEIAKLKKLKYLGLSYNLITGLPTEIGQLKQLEVLSLEKNKLRSLPSEIGLLTKLELLHVGYNNLSSIPSAIDRLVRKNNLDLRGADDFGTRTKEKGELISTTVENG